MTTTEMMLTIAVVVLGTMATRFLPFILFAKGQPPTFISYLGRVLPPAVIGLLIVFCLKDAVFSSSHGLPELIGIAAVAVMYRLWNNTLLSIGAGTVLYMVLRQVLWP